MIPSGSFRYTALEEVVYGQPAGQSLVSRVERMGSKRVFLMVSGTLNRETQSLIAEAMGRPGVEASDVLHEFIKDLGLTRNLEEVGGHIWTSSN